MKSIQEEETELIEYVQTTAKYIRLSKILIAISLFCLAANLAILILTL